MENKVLIKQATNKGFEELGLPGVADLSFPNSTTRRGRVQDKGRIAPCLETSNTGLTVFENRCDEPFRTFKDGVVGTLRTVEACGDKCVLEQKETNYKIRKLTPRECWRLMGFNDTDFDAAEKVNSNTQLYKQAGNSIVVNVLEELFKSLIE